MWFICCFYFPIVDLIIFFRKGLLLFGEIIQSKVLTALLAPVFFSKYPLPPVAVPVIFWCAIGPFIYKYIAQSVNNLNTVLLLESAN